MYVQPCRSFVPGSPATSRRTRLLAFAGGRLACYQCASSSVAPGQSIVPLLCSRRLSGRSMPGLKRSHTRAHMLPMPPPPPHKTRPASLTLGGPGSLCGAPTEAERVYDTHNDALAPNAARMRNTHGVAQWRFNGLSAAQCSESRLFFPIR